MKRIAWITVFALGASVTPAFAQSIYLGVGPSFPTGDYGEYANTGFLLAGGATFEVATNLDVYGEVSYGQNSHEGDASKTNPLGLMGGILYGFSGDQMPVEPYVFGGVGLLQHRFVPDEGDSESDSGFGFQAGAGVGFDLGGVGAFAEGRFTSANIEYSEDFSETTAFFAIVAGVSFDLGGGD